MGICEEDLMRYRQKGGWIVVDQYGGAKRAPIHSGRAIAEFIRVNVDHRRSVLCTDELPAYRWIGSKFVAETETDRETVFEMRRTLWRMF